MEIGIPKLEIGLFLEPSDTDEKTVNNTGLVILSASSLGSLDDLRRDEAAIWVGQNALVDLARHKLFDLILQSQSNLRNLFGRVRWRAFIGSISREN